MRTEKLEMLEARRLLADSYTIIDLGTAPSGSTTLSVSDVSGDFYGGARIVNGIASPFVARIGDPNMTNLKPLTGADSAQVLGLRANGDAVGYSYQSASPSAARATLWSAGKVFNLGAGAAQAISSNGIIVGVSNGGPVRFSTTAVPFSIGSIGNDRTGNAYGVNAAGTIVGVSGALAFSYNNGGMFDLTFQGSGTAGQAYAVDDSGQIVGSIDNHPFFTTGGNLVQYLTQRDGHGAAFDVNEIGQIVGTSGNTHGATLWEGGTASTLNDRAISLGSWDLTTATDISDTGRIIGYGTLDGARHAFALVPGGARLNGTGTLTVAGSSLDDTMSVGLKAGRIRVSINGSLLTFAPGRVKRINVSLGSGDDAFSLGAGVIGVGVDGGDGNDTIGGGDNADHLVGGNGNDKLTGYGARDSLEGGAGNDTLLGGSSVDLLDGGAGTDKSDFDRRETRKNIEGLV